MRGQGNPQPSRFWRSALLWVIGIEIIGNASGLITFGSIKGWYASLDRPPGTPPNGIFGPVWTILFALMGIAVALVWSVDRNGQPGLRRRSALRWFGVQFLANLAWTPAFFGFHRMDVALVIIVLLLVALALTIGKFAALSRRAALCLVPYFCWVSYAAYLNAGFWWLNR